MALSDEKRRRLTAVYNTTSYSGEPMQIGGTLDTEPLRGSSPKGEASPQPTISKNDLIAKAINEEGISQTPIVDNSFWATSGKAYEQIPSLTKNYLNYRMAQSPKDYKINKLFDENGKFNPHLVEPSEVYGEDFYALSPEDRGKRIKQVQDAQVLEAYGNVGSNPWGTTAGTVAGAVADPTTVVIPGGGSVKAAAAIGGAMGGIDMALESKLRKGEIDGSDVALGTAFGAAGGALIYAGGKYVSDLIQNSVKSRRPLDPEETREALEQAGAPEGEIADVQKTVTQFNEEAGLTQESSMSKIREAVSLHGKGIPPEGAEELKDSIVRHMEYYGDKMSDKDYTFLRKANEMYTKLESNPVGLPTSPLHDSISKFSRKGVTLKQAAKGAQKPKILVSEGEALDQMMRDLGDEALTKPSKGEAEEARKIIKDLHPQLKQAKDALKRSYAMKGSKRIRQAAISQRKKDVDNIEGYIKDRESLIEEYSTGKLAEGDMARIMQYQKGEIKSLPKALQKRVNKLRKQTQAVRRDVAKYNKTLQEADEKVTETVDSYIRQVDELSTTKSIEDLVPDPTISANNSSELAVKAVSRGEVALDGNVGRTVMPPTGKLSDEMTDAKAGDILNLTLVDHVLSTPRAVLQNKMGRSGNELARSIQWHQEAVNWDVANSLTDFKKILSDAGWYKASNKDVRSMDVQVTDLLRKDLDPSNADPRAVEVANGLRKQLNGIVDTMVARKIISKEDGIALKNKAKKDGYAPRVMDHEYLGTKKGEQHFKEVLTSAKVSKEQAYSIAKKWGGDSKELKPKGIRQNSDGTYSLSPGLVSKLYKSRMMQGKRSISSHMEKERTLHLPDEVLKPFLKNDIRGVMENYYYDVYRGSRAAEVFGKDGEEAARMLNDIHENYGDEAYKFAANAYSLHSRVEVNGADKLQTYLNQPEWQRRTVGWMRASMTPLLYTAQLLNLTQATVNGFMHLAGKQGIPKALDTTYRGLAGVLNKNNKDFLDRTGAAVQTQIMQIVNEHGDIPNRMSSWVLKWTQFQAIEELQRRIGASIGKVYVENLLDKKSQLLAQKASRNLSRAQEKELKDVLAGLSEMGMPDGKTVTVADMQMASQRFSNATNFTTGADQLPIAWQSPFMTLVRQFKSFAFLQGKFLKDNIVGPMKKGEFGKAANALVALGLAPMVAGGVPAMVGEIRKKWYTGEWSESKLEVALNAYTSIGGLGLIFDTALRATSNTPERFAFGLIGPSLSSAAKLATGAGQTVVSPLSEEGATAEPMLRSLLQVVPTGHKIREYTIDKDSTTGFENKYSGMYQER